MLPTVSAALAQSPMSSPVFLKYGFSTILEFDESPSEAVIGDGKSFQVEHLRTSLVVRPLVTTATTNLIVYFPHQKIRIFVLKVAEENDPSFFQTFKLQRASQPPTPKRSTMRKRVTSVVRASYSQKHDFLNVELEVVAPGRSTVSPLWNSVNLEYQGRRITPHRLWSERKEVLPGTSVRVQMEFVKPKLPADLAQVVLVLPAAGVTPDQRIPLKGVPR